MRRQSCDPEHLVGCPSCGQVTEVSEEVHHAVGEHGLRHHCWSCGETLVIPPTRSTLEHLRREREFIAVGMIAAGDIERGGAMFMVAERTGAQWRPPAVDLERGEQPAEEHGW